MKRFLEAVIFGGALLFAPLALRAQEYRGTIQGTITDQKGYTVGGASVEAASDQQRYKIITDTKGYFVIPFVQPGTYTLSVQAKGFRHEVRTGLILDVAQKLDLPIKLTAGGMSDTITVSTDEVQLATTDASGGTVMDPEEVQNLPLNGRQVYSLLALTPGVKFTQTQFGAGGYSGTRAWDTSNAYSITGQPGSYNQFLLNGAPISQQGGGASGTWNFSPSIDAVAEFKVMTITFDAQYGRVGGGAINTILKNGTPHFHGTLYDFWRNSALDANTYQLDQQGATKPYHNQHQFGGSVGGPFLKHNAFFFFSYEGWREVLPAGVVTTVPTSDLLPGPDGSVNLTNYLAAVSKTQIYDPNTTACAVPTAGGCSQYTRTAFVNNTIPASRISPIGVNILKLFPAPNRPGYTNNYVFNGKDTYRYNMPIARVDYNFSDRTKLYGIFAWWAGHENRNSNGLTGPAIQGNIDNYRSSITQVLDLTHTFSSRLVADVRLSFNRYYTLGPDGSVAAGQATLTAADLGLSMPQLPTTTHDYAPEIQINDNFPNIIGNTGDPNIFETYDLGPSVTQTIGKHTLHYGGEFSLYHDVTGGVGQPNGVFTFGTGFTQQNPFQSNKDGSSIAETLMGYANGGSVQYSFAPYESYDYFGFFAQDDFKVTGKLAVNAGLRWDEERSPRERHNRLLAGVCLTCPNPIGTQLGMPILGAVQFASDSLSAYDNNTGYFQPKIGLSYSPNRTMVFHGGYTLSKALGIELGGASAFSQNTNYNSSPDGGLHPATAFRSGTPYPNGYIVPPGTSQGAATLNGTGFGIDQRDRKIPIVQQYTIGFQTQLPYGIVADLVYLGAHTFRLRASKQLNGLTPGDFQKGHDDPNYLDQQVTNPFYGILPNTVSLGQNPTIQAKFLKVPYPQYDGNLYEYTASAGYSNYNSMLAKLEKRFSGNGGLSKGLSFLGSFTWSRLMSATGYLNNNGASLVDASPYYGVDGTDQPWNFAFSGLYGLPVGRGGMLASNAHGVLGAVINDWQFEWIFTNNGGTPSGFPNNDIYTCGGSYNIRPAKRSYKSYLNNTENNCFTTFPEYTAVTQKPLTTSVRNPSGQQTAFGLEKKFHVREGMNLQFKGEAFNATNTPIFGGPNTGGPEQAPSRNTSVGDPTQPGAWSGYGTIGSTEQNFPRQIQLSLKLLF
ncbi:TonB-dependent receptor [Granulicella arctica]|uniref:TonB-dependent receptor n=1 Tax=Granulicella arctica TaxID=940613 RepID=UPI0021DFAB04|nr:carboxypeptidase regulatory-like domain-containing protein [Granulicella arctica]